MKRLFDLTIGFIILICSFPFMIFIGILVKTKIGSPIIFKQLRPGLEGKPFYLYKFRTMKDSIDDYGALLPDNQRLTKVGKFLRKYSLDELPQFINVVKGDLSLVGPRPLLMEYLPLYSAEQRLRHHVRPGITGWAQINGRNSISWNEKFLLDVWYVKNQSFILDLKIIFLTIFKVLSSAGVNQTEMVTMEKFEGTNTVVREGHG
ncbi:sugar transferase [Falsibacillus pallidus]|uniref:Sugar transferase EpsL n=1 Tax=Falsibacillus pallidus TaxID=493781 RepID=A0A370GPR3_9BACI|nr:sugar transferase [Falsibacillus pallidus]RDI45712.1 sugar transferase EpsL [Falsibacillus pallidus]